MGEIYASMLFFKGGVGGWVGAGEFVRASLISIDCDFHT